MKQNDFVIVIQGPIITSGNSGDGTFVNNLNCIENIQNLISASRHLVKGFILCTWKSTIPFPLDEDVIVLELDDPGSKPVIGHQSPSNEFRQSYGCLFAINKAIEKHDPEYLLKIRTDQFIDLPKVIEHIIRTDEKTSNYEQVGQEGFIYFPNMLSWSPYSVGDFFIGGHARDIQLFFEAQVALSNHTFGYDFSWLHSDIILRHAFRNLRSKLLLPDEYFFPNITPSFRLYLLHQKFPIKFHPAIIRLWSIILQQSISFFPRAISEDMIWRGTKMNFEKHTMGEFFEEWESEYPDFENWLFKLYPELYLNKKDVSSVDKFLHFYTEKLVEIREKRPVFRRHIYRVIRMAVSLLKGYYPKEIIIPLSTAKRFMGSISSKFFKPRKYKFI